MLVRLGAPGLKPELLVLELSSVKTDDGLPLAVEAMVFVRERAFGLATTSVFGSAGSGGGVGQGVTSVLAVISTSSASRYHFLRLVYLPQVSCPRFPFCHWTS